MNNSQIVLQTNGLSKSFGDISAVKMLSLSIYKGEIFGFLGPNGAGKTTSINMICGLLKPDSGNITINDITVNSESDEMKHRVGVCPQDIIIWNKLTCLEQLVFTGELYGMEKSSAYNRSIKLLEDLKLYDKKDKLAGTLSGGMKRRLNIALALVHNPEIIVFDEPEAGLDPQSRVLVRDYIKSLAKVKTVILTTHNMDEAERVCDRVAIIDHGELLIVDTPEMLKHSGENSDIIELKAAGENKVLLDKILFELNSKIISTGYVDDVIVISVKNAASVLPDILQKFKEANILLNEVKLREQTLEDVFIKLTGRRLRE